MAGGDGSAPGSIVRQWLSSLGLAQYCQAFYDNGYDELEICKAIGPADLEAIGVSCAEHQDALLASVRTMREEGATSVYFTLEPSATTVDAAASFKPPTEWVCPPPPDQQPPPPPLPPFRATANDSDKYAEGKTALAHGGDLSGIAAAIATAARSLSDSTAPWDPNTSAIGNDVVDDRSRPCARSAQFSSQSTPSASPAHSCHHQQQQFSKLSGRCSATEITQMGSAAATPPVRTIEHTCGRGGSVRVPAAGTAALAQQWQHRRQQRCACCSGSNNFDGSAMRHAQHRGHLHSSSAPVTPAHAATAMPSSRASGLGGVPQQLQQQQQQHTPAASAATALTHEERMKVLCEMTQGQLSVGEAVALLSQKRSSKPASEDPAIAGDPARRPKKTTEKRASNFLKLLSFRKGKKTQSQDQDRSEKKGHKQQQQLHHDAIATSGDAAPKSGRPVGKQSSANGSAADGRLNGMPVASLHGADATGAGCAHTAQAACSGCVGSSSAVKWAMSRSHLSGRGRLLSYDGGGAGGGSSSTSSGSLTSVAGLGSSGGGGCSGNGCCRCSHGDRGGSSSVSSSRGGTSSSAAVAATAAGQRSNAPAPRHNFFYSPQVARRHYDPAGRRWTEDGDDDDSVWLPTSGAGVAAAGSAMTMRPEATTGAGRRRLPARSPTVDFTGASGSCSVVDHVGFEHVDQRKRDSGCYGSGDCLHPRTSVGGGSSGGHLKLSVSSSSSLSSRDSCSTAAATAAAPTSAAAAAGADSAAASGAGLMSGLLGDDRCCSSDRLDAQQRCHHHRCNRGDAPSLHRDAGSVSSLSAAVPSHSRLRRGSASMQQQQPQRQPHLTQLFRGLDLDVALRLQQYGISLHDSPYTTADGRWSVPPAVVMRLAQEVAIEAQEACAILDRVRVKLLAAVGKPAVALEMSFQEPAVAAATRMRQQQPASVCHFLLTAGLPGYEGLFALHGYETIDQVASMTQADILRCGISDAAHIHTLLSHAGQLPRSQSGGGAADRAANGRCPSQSALVGMS